MAHAVSDSGRLWAMVLVDNVLEWADDYAEWAEGTMSIFLDLHRAITEAWNESMSPHGKHSFPDDPSDQERERELNWLLGDWERACESVRHTFATHPEVAPVLREYLVARQSESNAAEECRGDGRPGPSGAADA